MDGIFGSTFQMLTGFILFGCLLIVSRGNPEICWNTTKVCPQTEFLWEKRTKEFHCPKKDTNYTCLLNKDGDLVETCIIKIDVPKDVVGCPFIMLCLDGYPQVGTENKYMACPENIPGCPQKNHDVYTLYEIYKYPACFYYNKSEVINVIQLETTMSSFPPTTYRVDGNQNETTEHHVHIAVIVTVLTVITIIVVVAAIVWCKRYRKSSARSAEDGMAGSPLLNTIEVPPTINIKFVEDGKLEVSWEAPQDLSNVDQYFIYRKKEVTDGWELLHTETSTKTKVLTEGILKRKGIYYGVAARRLGKIGNITSTLYPMSEEMLKAQANKEVFDKFRSDLLEKMDGRTNSIQMSPLDRTKTIRIDNLYSSVIVHQKNKQMRALEIEQRVEHPRDIFYVASDMTRYVFMTGLPARGKTAYCQWLTHMWCKAKKESPGENAPWEKGLNEFDFVFFVLLRNVSNVDTIPDMICSDLFKNDSVSRDHIAEILNSTEYRCLIILDGLDELKSAFSLPDMEGFPQCTFFISTRPWKYSDISYMYVKEKDKAIEIIGLDKSGINRVTQTILRDHYKFDETSEEFSTFYEKLTKNARISVMKTSMHIPLLALICVQVLCDEPEYSIGNSVTSFYVRMLDFLIKSANEKGQISRKSDSHQCQKSKDLLKGIITTGSLTIFEYSDALLKLSELAFDSLTMDELVMEKDDLETRLGKDQLQFVLDVGLLSQGGRKVSFNKVHINVSFFHKSFQEVLAAIHVAVTKKERFTETLTDMKKILKYSNVIMFVSGFHPELGTYILLHIADVLDKDVMVSEYREKLFDIDYRSDMSSLYKLQTDCYREMKHNLKPKLCTGEMSTLPVTDIILEDEDDIVVDDTTTILRNHLPQIKSAFFLRVPSRGKNALGDGLLSEFLDSAETLQSLFISGYEHGRIVHHLRLSTLTVLSLMYISVSDINPVDESFSIVPLLNDMNSLEVLKLNHVSFGNKSLGINSQMTKLKKIVLQWVEMCLWGRFFDSLTHIKQKYEVKLSYSNADDHSMKDLYDSPNFHITWYGGKARTHFFRIPCAKTNFQS